MLHSFARTRGGPEKGRLSETSLSDDWLNARLAAEAVQSATLTFQSVYDVQSSDGLSFSVLGVSDSVTDHVFQEHFQDATSLFVDKTRDAFHSASTCQSSNGWFRDSLDIVTQDLAMTLRASLSKSFSSFASSRHVCFLNSIVELLTRVERSRDYLLVFLPSRNP